MARAPGGLTEAVAASGRSAGAAACPAADAELRAERLGRDLARFAALQADIAALETQIDALLGQQRRAGPDHPARRRGGPGRRFAAFSLPIERFPTAEHLYSATGLAPAPYASARSAGAAGSPAQAWPSTATR